MGNVKRLALRRYRAAVAAGLCSSDDDGLLRGATIPEPPPTRRDLEATEEIRERMMEGCDDE